MGSSMRLTHFALALTLILLAITGYLAWEGQQEARGARKELEFVKKQQAAQETAHPKPENIIPLPTAPTNPVASIPSSPAPSASITPPPAVGTIASTPMAGATALPGITPVPPPVVGSAPAAAPSASAAPTPLQKQIKEAPAVGKVKAVEAKEGFLVLSMGSNQGLTPGMKFEIRRDSSVLAKITVGETIDLDESVANINTASVPPGVSIEVGDDVIKPTAP